MGASILSVLALVGVALTYWFLQQKIDNQKRQTRKTFEELQSNYEVWMQETLKSLQEAHQIQLKQATEKLKQEFESQLHNAIAALQKTSHVQQNQTVEEFIPHQDSQPQDTLEALQTTHPTEATQTADELNEVQDSQVQETVQPIEEQFPDLWQEDEQLLGENIDTEADTEIEEKDESKSEEQTLVQSPLETQQVPLDFSSTPSDNSIQAAANVSNTAKPKTKGLPEVIIALGNPGQITSIPKLTEYANHPNSHIRELAASALGKIAVSQGARAEIQRTIPLLGKLSRDSEASVRQSAVEALGKIKSETVIPLLSLALRDSNMNVVRVASAALNQFKYYPMNQGKKPAKAQAKASKR